MDKYINYINEDIAEMHIFDYVGDGGVEANDFVNEFKWLESNGVKTIKIRINSYGGSVIDGYSIFSVIFNSKVNTETYIDGIGASIAGIIAMAGKKRYMVDYGQLMIHDPSFSGGKLSEKDKRALASIKDSLVKIFVNHSIVNESDLSEYMATETWFNAEDAKEYGFIDEIIKTERNITFQNDAMALYTIVNQILKPNRMEKIQNHFGLDSKATETEILNKVTALETEKKEAETKALEVEIENKTLKSKIATLYVKNDIEKGKFAAEKEAELIEMAEKDIDSYLSISNAVTNKPLDITNMIDMGKSKDSWTLDEWQTKDPDGLMNMLKNEPSKYQKLTNDKYNKK